MIEYKYKNFDELWRVIVPAMWNVKEWDNETIKAWCEEVFESSRETKSN